MILATSLTTGASFIGTALSPIFPVATLGTRNLLKVAEEAGYCVKSLPAKRYGLQRKRRVSLFYSGRQACQEGVREKAPRGPWLHCGHSAKARYLVLQALDRNSATLLDTQAFTRPSVSASILCSQSAGGQQSCWFERYGCFLSAVASWHRRSASAVSCGGVPRDVASSRRRRQPQRPAAMIQRCERTAESLGFRAVRRQLCARHRPSVAYVSLN